MSLHTAPDHKPRPSFVDGNIWRAAAWVGVVLQAAAAALARWSENLGGLWIILGFLAGSVVFLLAVRHLPSLLAFVAILAAAINAGGWAWSWYAAVPWFDELVHTYSPLAIVAVLMFWFRRARIVRERPASGRWVVIAAGCGLGLGVAWEALEFFFIDLSLQDTSIDLALDALGASMGGWLSGWVIRRLEAVRVAA